MGPIIDMHGRINRRDSSIEHSILQDQEIVFASLAMQAEAIYCHTMSLPHLICCKALVVVGAAGPAHAPLKGAVHVEAEVAGLQMHL